MFNWDRSVNFCKWYEIEFPLLLLDFWFWRLNIHWESLSFRQFLIWANIIFEWNMPSPKFRSFDCFRRANPIHSKMPEVIFGWVPCHQIPKWLKDKHCLWFDFPQCLPSFRVFVIKPDRKSTALPRPRFYSPLQLFRNLDPYRPTFRLSSLSKFRN